MDGLSGKSVEEQDFPERRQAQREALPYYLAKFSLKIE